MNQPIMIGGPRAGRIAMLAQPGRSPAVMFLPGFNSDMRGSKAEHLAAFCAARGQAFLRFDYSGHGQSDGAFADGTISRWRDDALAVIDAAPAGPLVLVGSSMGGWIGLLAALARPDRIAALVGIAAAPDFTEALMWDAMAPAERAALLRDGVLNIPADGGTHIAMTRALIEDGRRHLLLHAPIPLTIKVRLLHGQQDRDVPWQRSLSLAQCLAGADVQVLLIKDAAHRLSRPGDLAALTSLLEPLLTATATAGEDGA